MNTAIASKNCTEQEPEEYSMEIICGLLIKIVYNYIYLLLLWRRFKNASENTSLITAAIAFIITADFSQVTTFASSLFRWCNIT